MLEILGPPSSTLRIDQGGKIQRGEADLIHRYFFAII